MIGRWDLTQESSMIDKQLSASTARHYGALGFADIDNGVPLKDNIWLTGFPVNCGIMDRTLQLVNR